MKLIDELNERLKENPALFRIELLERFYKILDNKELVFVKPLKWTDPLENLIFNAKILKNGREFHHPSKEKIFGQCWSYEGDSYALWQVYTTKKDDNGIFTRHLGVRITTRLDRLNMLGGLNNGTFYYGLVKYLSKTDIEKLPKDPNIIRAISSLEISEDHLRTILVKRKSYSYEKEVRFITIPVNEMVDKDEKDICRVKIDPKEFITSIRFDPGMDYREFKIRKNELVEKYSFKPTQITQSTYFKRNKFIIEIQ